MNKLPTYLNKPAPYSTKPWVIVLTASLLVGFLLGLFQPFGIDTFNATVRLYMVIGFTCVTALSTSIVGYLFPCLFKKFFTPSEWTIGKSLLSNILLLFLIALGNSIFNWSIRHNLESTFGSVFLSYLLVTFLIGIIPFLVSTFIVQNIALKKNLQDAIAIKEQLNERLQDKKQINHIETGLIKLSGETKETVALYPDHILYLESAGNYVKINYLSENSVKQKLIRTTITQIANDLQGYPYLVRCHRAYMVNVSHINHVEGNSQGLQLNLRHLKDQIPVSRTYIKEIKDKL